MKVISINTAVIGILKLVVLVGSLLQDHAGPVYAHVSQHECWKFVPMPEKDHRMQHETPDHRQCQVDKSVRWKGRLVDVKEQKQQKEKVWKVLQALAAP